jgi:phosphate transport system protein
MPESPQAFDARLDQLRSDLVDQGRRVQAMLEEAFEAVFNRNTERAKVAVQKDDEIDAVDVVIEKTAVSLLGDATRQGASLTDVQLRTVLTIVKVNNELERIADCALEVATCVGSLRPDAPPYPGTFRVMANSVVGILRDSCTSIAKSDPVLAKVVLQSQHAVTAFKDALLRDAETKLTTGNMPIDFAFHLHEIANQCELMADHCTNIAEQVIYLTTGGIVRHVESAWIEIPKTK